MDRPSKLAILVASNRRSLDEIDRSLEALESGPSERSHFSTLARGFHTIKHEALSLGLARWADAAAAAEAIVEKALERRIGLPLEILQAASREFRKATDAVAAGTRHRLNKSLVGRLSEATPRDAGR